MNTRISVATIQSPEFINLQSSEISPLISKCEIKVLYVGQNRNRSCISKEVATEMSKTLRGNPIVGYYIENKEDFGDHGDQMIIDGEGVKFNKLTKPYGFVAPDAKVWFQFFEDQDEFGNTCVREYLMTEGYLWTGQFEECQRVLENNNPQSMELDEKTLKGHWSTDLNKGVDFFIINDAVFSKLCILGDDVEPCFEGANISAPNLSSQFSKNDDFSKTLFSMIEDLKNLLNNSKGGKQMLNNELDNKNESTSFENESTLEAPAVQFDEAGGEASAEGETSSNDSSLEGEGESNIQTMAYLDEGTTPGAGEEDSEEGEDESQEEDVLKDVVLNKTDEEISKNLEEGYAPKGEEDLEALIKDGAENKRIILNSKADDEEEKKDKEDKSDSEKTEDTTEEEKDDKKKNFSLEKELEELRIQFSKLEEENKELLAFKQEVEDKEKTDLINSFYMLSDEDKKDVINNKAKYSLKEIKAELSMICVDKKVNFENEGAPNGEPVIFNMQYQATSELPTWLQAVAETQNRNK